MVPHGYVRSSSSSSSNSRTKNLIEELHQSAEKSRVISTAIGQPSSTAIQIALVNLLVSWGVKPSAVVGHSSGEIAAAYACGSLSFESALTVAFYRGLVVGNMAVNHPSIRGAMLAVGLSEEEARRYIAEVPAEKGQVEVACVNSPRSTTLSGDRAAILKIQSKLEANQVFVRRLAVSTAYHSRHMRMVGDEYRQALQNLQPSESLVRCVSSVTGTQINGASLDAAYWEKNLVSPVRFSDALQCLCLPSSDAVDGSATNPNWSKFAVDILVEIGPHSALSGPIKQILTTAPLKQATIDYIPSLIRNRSATQSVMESACALFAAGCPINLDRANRGAHDMQIGNVLVDLPPYPWDHAIGYWHESRLSLDYRQRPHPRHHLLGAPSSDFNPLEPRWKNIIRVAEIPWVRGHVIQSNIVYPAAGYIAMALEASQQRFLASGRSIESISRFRILQLSIGRALIVPEDPDGIETIFALRAYNRGASESSDIWDEFRVFSCTRKGARWDEHCRGLISIELKREVSEVESDREAKQKAASHQRIFLEAKLECTDGMGSTDMYKTLEELGLKYQEPFTNILDVVAKPYRSLGTVRVPNTAAVMPEGFEHPQILHPATLDSCLHVLFPSLLQAGALRDILVPTFVDEILISGDVSTMKPGDLLHVHVSTSRLGARACKADLTAVRDDDSAPMIELAGLRCTSLATGLDMVSAEEAHDRRLGHKIGWGPDIELLSANYISDMCSAVLPVDDGAAEELTQNITLSFYFIQAALQSLTTLDEQKMAKHHKHLYNWMKDVSASGNFQKVAQSQADGLMEKVAASGAEGKMLCRIGVRLTSIMTGESDPLPLMMEDHLLYEVYRNKGSVRCYAQMVKYVDMLSFKNPGLRVLEIGAGTGGATIPLLQSLASSGLDRGRRLERYDFTDISSGFFEKAEQLLMPWNGLVKFLKLDVEKDPQPQGFELESYDLIIASNVLHATRVLDDTMHNVRKLLKPDGKLLLVETTRPKLHHNVVFGTLPGWWLGRGA